MANDSADVKPALSVITDPVPYGFNMPIEWMKHYLRCVKRIFKPLPHYMVSCYRGHPSVTRSLVEGLENIGVHANYNPQSLNALGETVVVLSGIAALTQCIQLKRKGYIKKLLAGPNMVEIPSDYEGIATSPEIDSYIINCEWTNKMYREDCPSLSDRLVIWPAGVDTCYWKPDDKRKSNTILIYEKQRKGPVGPVQPYKQWLEKQGHVVQVIRCGEYTLSEFLDALKCARLMIGFVIDESQGLAWAEAWSVNVPTLIWRNTKSTHRGKPIEVSTAPYLTKNTGLFFDNFDDFKHVFSQWESMRESFTPRQWVIDNMSDEACARQLCQLADVSY